MYSMEAKPQRLPAGELLAFFDAVVQHEMRLWDELDQAVLLVSGVRLGGFQALRMVARREGLGRVGDVAADLGVTVGAVSKIVDRLVDRDLVTRRRHHEDGRSSLLVLTATGEAALTRGLDTMTEVLAAHLDARLGPDDQRAALTLFATLAKPVRDTQEPS
jgi:MarR family multiple antibiotic resistance transcriptional regulator